MKKGMVRRVSWCLLLMTVVFGFTPEVEAASSPSEGVSLPAFDRQSDLHKIQKVLATQAFAERLRTLGFTRDEIQTRLNRLDDQQIHQMALNVEELKAGGDGGEVVIALLAIMILAVLIYILLGHRGSERVYKKDPGNTGRSPWQKPSHGFRREAFFRPGKGGQKMSMKGWRGVGLTGLILVSLAFAPLAFAQEKAKAEEARKESGAVAITRLAVGTGVENRELRGAAERFPLDTEKVYCLLEAANIPRDMEITLLWFNGDKEVGKFSLPLKKGPRWRTWAFKNLRGLKGEWKVEVRDPDGKVLRDARFKVE